jgi:methyl-accepting chemotaxis protein
MGFLERMKVRYRLAAISVLSVLMVVGIVWEAAGSLNEALLEARLDKTRHLVETAHSVLGHFHELEQKGALPRAEAQRAAIAAVKQLRYEEKEYFWVNDMQPRMVMHPFKPELDGKDLSEFRDPSGISRFVEMVDVVKKSGGGYVDYMWPRPGASEPQPKISYVKGFAPWGWVIGSGIYISDLKVLFWQHMREGAILAAVGVVLILATAWLAGRSIVRQLGGEPDYVVAAASRIAAGDLTAAVTVKAGDTCSITYSIQQMQARLTEVIRQIHDNSRTISRAVQDAAQAAETVREGSQRQSEAAAATAAAIEQMSVSISHVSDNTGETRNESRSASEQALRGEQLASNASEGIATIRNTVSLAARQI